MWWWGPCAGSSCVSDVVATPLGLRPRRASDYDSLRPLMTDRTSLTPADLATDEGDTAPGLYTACHRVTQELVALKVLDRRALRDKRTRRRLRQELRVLKLASSHPNLLTLHGVYATRARVEIAFELARGGEVLSRLQSGQGVVVNAAPPLSASSNGSTSATSVVVYHFSEREMSRVGAQVTAGLQFLHARGLVHGEVRPEHVLYSDSEPDARVLLAAFGRAAPWRSLSLRCRPSTRGFLWDDVHHIRFLPPFVLRRKAAWRKRQRQRQLHRRRSSSEEDKMEQEDPLVKTWQEAQQLDIWALGVTLYVLLCACFPFSDDSSSASAEADDVLAIERRVLHEPLRFPTNGIQLSRAARDLLRRMLEKDAEAAMSIDEVATHPWLGGGVAPDVSWSASRLQQHRAFAAAYADEVAAVSRRRRVSARTFSSSLRGLSDRLPGEEPAVEVEPDRKTVGGNSADEGSQERPSFVSTHGLLLDEEAQQTQRPSAECFMRLASMEMGDDGDDEDDTAAGDLLDDVASGSLLSEAQASRRAASAVRNKAESDDKSGEREGLWQGLLRHRRFLSFKSLSSSVGSQAATPNGGERG